MHQIIIHKNVTDHLIQVTIVLMRPEDYDMDYTLHFIQNFLHTHINTGPLNQAAKEVLFVRLQDDIVQSAINQLEP